MRISMDGKGRALDTIFTERLWRTVKYEEVYLHDYASPKEARQGLTRYLSCYNDERPHQSLGYKTPAEVYHTTTKNMEGYDGPAPLSLPSQKGDESTFFGPSFVS